MFVGSFFLCNTPKPPAAPLPSATLSAAYAANSVTLRGTVPSEADRTTLLERARRILGAVTVVDSLTIDAGRRGLWMRTPALDGLFYSNLPPGVTAQMEEGVLRLTGTVPSDSVKAAVVARARNAAGATVKVDDFLAVAPPPAQAQQDVNAILAVKNVEFESKSDVLTPIGRQTLDEVAAALGRGSDSVDVVGHTDNRGKAADNAALSLARATAAVQYLVSKGLDGSRFRPSGLGSSRPVADNATAEGRQRNRRIEFVVRGAQ